MERKELTIPLSSIEPEVGSIKLSYDDDIGKFDTLFSYTMYVNMSVAKFIKSVYYKALMIYINIIHNPIYERFKNTGIIIYTNSNSVSRLLETFSQFPKVIIAEVLWPNYTLDSGNVDDSILRCMRFQALDAFPDKIILVRDADSLFPYEIQHLEYILYHLIDEDENKLEIEYKNIANNSWKKYDSRASKFLENLIAEWELKFIEKWFNVIQKPIVLGTDRSYTAVWHKNIPFIYTPARKNQEEGHIKPKIDFAFDVNGQGVFAGFANFMRERPNDIWILFYNYLNSRYYIMTENGRKKISNIHSAVISVGKDERMILFALIPRYLEYIYFYKILYYGAFYYSKSLNEHFAQVKSYKPTALMRIKHNNKHNPLINFSTILLHPDYHEVIDTAATNEKFTAFFADMVARYQAYLHEMTAKSNEELQKLTGNTLEPTRRLKGGKRRKYRYKTHKRRHVN